MPIIKRAIKKLRHDRIRTIQNQKIRSALKKLVQSMRKKPTAKAFITVQKALDKATKRHIIHANRASRLKSRLSKLLKK